MCIVFGWMGTTSSSLLRQLDSVSAGSGQLGWWKTGDGRSVLCSARTLHVLQQQLWIANGRTGEREPGFGTIHISLAFCGVCGGFLDLVWFCLFSYGISPSEIQPFPLKCVLLVLYKLASVREIPELLGDGIPTPGRCLSVLSSAPFWTKRKS